MDKIFKIGLLVLGFGYLAYLFGVGSNIDTANAKETSINKQVTNQVGRYSYDSRVGFLSIMDTTNGDTYMLISDGKYGWVKCNPIIDKTNNPLRQYLNDR